MENLNARFSDSTPELFKRYGIQNAGYWNPWKASQRLGGRLVYMLTHKSVEAAREAFGEFCKAPDWIAARKESEEDAEGSRPVVAE